MIEPVGCRQRQLGVDAEAGIAVEEHSRGGVALAPNVRDQIADPRMHDAPRILRPWRGGSQHSRCLHLQLFIADHQAEVGRGLWIEVGDAHDVRRAGVGVDVGAGDPIFDIAGDGLGARVAGQLLERALAGFDAAKQHPGRVGLWAEIDRQAPSRTDASGRIRRQAGTSGSSSQPLLCCSRSRMSPCQTPLVLDLEHQRSVPLPVGATVAIDILRLLVGRFVGHPVLLLPQMVVASLDHCLRVSRIVEPLFR